ncbi:MAG TPA: Stp1/IreP family PP2C-type Ser/Thr phosphatase [Gemmatimonadaceae bacterium]|nr:Stp1/IreP family PP2C-type Ser/Thr phosphatase [Gemmatimonadaceae bacterium]
MSGNSSSRGDVLVHVFGKTDVGRTREHNEDSFVVADLTTMNATLQPEVRSHQPGERGTLFMVADGMGGAAAGEIASQMATEVVLDELDARWRQAHSTDPEIFARALKAACETANARIHKYAMEHPENRGMGTTATIAGFLGDTLYLAQVGDSRGYILRNGVAQQITKDQSLMQKLVEAGELTAEEAEVSERRNIILQALGPEAVVKVDLTTQQVRRGDILVLCSDGLSGQVRANEIARIINEEPDLVAACRALIDLANENGGPDNITVVTARFEGEGLAAPSDGEDPAHQVYTSQSEQRTTQPVVASSIPAMTPEEELAFSDAPTLETEPVNPGRVLAASGAASNAALAGAPADSAPPFARNTTPDFLAATGRGRVSGRALRLIFGTIAVVIAAILLLKFLRK